jgi:hypothetical protein
MFYELYKNQKTTKKKKTKRKNVGCLRKSSTLRVCSGVLAAPFNMMAYRFNHPDSMLNNDYGIMALSLFLVSFSLFLLFSRSYLLKPKLIC